MKKALMFLAYLLVSASIVSAFSLDSMIQNQVGEMMKGEAAQSQENKCDVETTVIEEDPAIDLATLSQQVDVSALLGKIKTQAAKIKTQYAEYEIKAKIMGFEKTMLGRSWTKLPNMSRFEVYEPADMASTTINNGFKSVYIDKDGKVKNLDKRQQASSSYQTDYGMFLDDFDIALAGGTRNVVHLMAAAKPDTSFSEMPISSLIFIVDRTSNLIIGYDMKYKDMDMVAHSDISYDTDDNGILYVSKVVMTMQPPNSAGMPDMLKSTFTMVTTKVMLNGAMSEDYFAIPE
ncbi:MAG: hypothetical protein ABH823_01210 [bacterium]